MGRSKKDRNRHKGAIGKFVVWDEIDGYQAAIAGGKTMSVMYQKLRNLGVPHSTALAAAEGRDMSEGLIPVDKVPLKETAMAKELAATFGLPAESIVNLIKHQIIAVPNNQQPASDAELALVLSVMRKYQLDPMTKQMHAWRDNRGKLAIMVGFDGWVDYAMKQPGYIKVSYQYGPMVKSPDGKGKECWAWVQATVHDSRRGEIEMAPTFLDEWYMPGGNYPGPWQKQTRHKLRIKAFSLAVREAYGLGGVDVGDLDDRDYYRPAVTVDDTVDRMADELLSMSKGADLVPEPAQDDHEDGFIPADYDDIDDGNPSPSSDQDAPSAAEDVVTPCGSRGCSSGATHECKDCGTWYCWDHMGKGGLCRICDDGGE